MKIESVTSFLKVNGVDTTAVDRVTFSVLPEQISGYDRTSQLAAWCSSGLSMLEAATNADIATTVAIYKHLDGQSPGNLWYGMSHLRDFIGGQLTIPFDNMHTTVNSCSNAINVALYRVMPGAHISTLDELINASVIIDSIGHPSKRNLVLISIYGNKTKTLLTAVVMDNDSDLIDNFANRWFALQMHARVRPDLYGCSNITSPYPFGFRIGAVDKWYESYVAVCMGRIKELPNPTLLAHRSAMDLIAEYSPEELLKLDPVAVAQFESNHIGKDTNQARPCISRLNAWG